jgi:ParB-like chromosome segregation protein Spo0J
MTDKPAPITVAMAKRIEMWPVERLVPYEKNSRLHSPEQVAQVAASIAEFGFTNPILVDSGDGIIAGHGRLAAAKELGMDEVPVVVLDHLSQRQRRAYVIADNKLALNASWDVDVLAAEIDELRGEDFDIDLLGFSADELKGLMTDDWGTDIDPTKGEDEELRDRQATIKVKLDPTFVEEITEAIQAYADEHEIELTIE